MHLYVGTLFCLLTLIGYKLGMLKGVESEMSILDRVSLSNFGYRYSFGYCWATDFASHVMFLILTFWYLKEGVFKNIDYLILMCITAFTLFYTDSRLVFLMIVAIILLSIYCKMIYRNKVTPGKKTFNLFLLLIPILASLSFWMVTNYNPVNPFWFVINALMTGRLNLCYDALKYVGISPFGQYYELIGSGQGEETNYIDISYIQLAVIYGIVFTLVVICLYMYMSFRAYKRKDIVTAIIIVLVSVEALIAQHYMLLEFNPILLGLLAKHNYSQTLLYQKSI